MIPNIKSDLFLFHVSLPHLYLAFSEVSYFQVQKEIFHVHFMEMEKKYALLK